MKHSKGSVHTDGCKGRLAQLEERLVCNQKAGGSNPPASTIPFWPRSVRVLFPIITTPLRLNPFECGLTSVHFHSDRANLFLMMADVVGGGMRSCYVLGMSLVHELLDVCIDPCNIDGWSACIRYFPPPAGEEDSRKNEED